MDKIIKLISDVNSGVSSFVWGPVMLAVFLGIGIFFSIKTGFFQLFKIRLWFGGTVLELLRNKETRRSGDKNSISRFGAVSTALAATIGTGSVVGVATAISLGGAGAVFWMWVSSFFGMMTAYAENVLGIKYRTKNAKGEWLGGAMMYIEKGLKLKSLACVFAFLCIFSSLGIGNMTQANSVSYAVEDLTGIPKAVTGIVLTAVIGVIVLGGIKRISFFTQRIVPVIAILYTVVSLVVIIGNIKSMPSVLARIISEAFSLKSVGGGIFGSVMMTAMRFGISRGVFSNEAGLGTSVTIHCASDIKEPAEQGMWSIFEVFVDTMVVCTLTAFCVLSSGLDISGSVDAVSLTSEAFSSVLGKFGFFFIELSIIAFSFATLMSGSYLGEKSAEYLFGSRGVKRYRAVYIAAVFIGCVSNLELVWSVADTFNGLLAIPNLFSIAVLSPEVFEITKKYLKNFNFLPKKSPKNTYGISKE